MGTRGTSSRHLPDWAIGLMIAAVIFALILLVVADLVGVGDDPTLGVDDRALTAMVVSA